MTTLHLKKSIARSPWRLGFLLIPLALVCFALAPLAEAAPPPKPEDRGNGNSAAENVSALNLATTGSNNTAHGWFSLFSNTTGAVNTANGAFALFSNTTGDSNTANGYQSLYSNTTGYLNTATGRLAHFSNTTGHRSTATGDAALYSNTTGILNTADGQLALFFNTTGNGNTALGRNAGKNIINGSNNIDIGYPAPCDEPCPTNPGPDESNTIRIGDPAVQSATFIAGISGATVTGTAVVVGSSGQLGVAPSSARFKEAIKPMDNTSEALFSLKPVTFRYKKEIDPKSTAQFGLVAEEVEKVNADLVVRDAEGKVYTVRYEAVNAMLLNEFLKEHRKNEEQEGKIQEQAASIATLKSTVAQQQKGMEAVTARLHEQGAQIQKVSAQLEASKPAPQVVNNP